MRRFMGLRIYADVMWAVLGAAISGVIGTDVCNARHIVSKLGAGYRAISLRKDRDKNSISRLIQLIFN